MKTHLSFGDNHRVYPELSLEGVAFLYKSCCNKYIRHIFHSRNKLTPRGNIFWKMLIPDIVWKKSLVDALQILYIKILHKIHPCNCCRNVLILMISAFFAGGKRWKYECGIFLEKPCRILIYLFQHYPCFWHEEYNVILWQW
jgi:hypothetical protein